MLAATKRRSRGAHQHLLETHLGEMERTTRRDQHATGR
jgi:hypothetical protein